MRTHEWIIWGVIAFAGLAVWPGGGAAQDLDEFRRGPTGLRLDLGLAISQPRLNGASGDVFEQAGKPSAGGGYQVAIGYDASKFGVTIGLDLTGHRLGTRNGTVLSGVALARWRPVTARAGGWNPVLSAGYVRQAFGGVEMRPAELPPYLREQQTPQDTFARDAAILGNGVRLAVAGERPVSRRAAFAAEVSGDLVHLESVNYRGADISPDQDGTTFLPRLSVGLRFWPFARR